jgi:hypothetical protein
MPRMCGWMLDLEVSSDELTAPFGRRQPALGNPPSRSKDPYAQKTPVAGATEVFF